MLDPKRLANRTWGRTQSLQGSRYRQPSCLGQSRSVLFRRTHQRPWSRARPADPSLKHAGATHLSIGASVPETAFQVTPLSTASVSVCCWASTLLQSSVAHHTASRRSFFFLTYRPPEPSCPERVPPRIPWQLQFSTFFIRHMVKTRFTRQSKDSESGRRKKRRQGSQQQNSSKGSISDISSNSQLLLPFHRLQKSVSFFFPLLTSSFKSLLVPLLVTCRSSNACCVSPFQSSASSSSASRCVKDMTLIPASSGPSKKCSNSLTSTWILSLLSLYFSIVSRTTIASPQTVGPFWWAWPCLSDVQRCAFRWRRRSASHTFCHGFNGQNFMVWVCS